MASMMDIRRNVVANQPHIETATGDETNLISDISAPLKSCKVSFSPIQDTSNGDPSLDNICPISGRTGLSLTTSYIGANDINLVGYSASDVSKSTSTRILTNNYGTTISTIEPKSSVIITQTQYPLSNNPGDYRNGYFVFVDNNLIFGSYYFISFRISNIINNPLNATLEDIRVTGPSGTSASKIVDNNRIYAKMKYSQLSSSPERHSIGIRNCGMSFTFSDLIIIECNEEDTLQDLYNKYVVKDISWEDSAGTVYGGYIDIMSGELVVEYNLVSAPWKNWTFGADLGSNTRKTIDLYPYGIGGNASDTSWCNLTGTYIWSNSEDTPHIYVASTGKTGYAVLPNTLDEN